MNKIAWTFISFILSISLVAIPVAPAASAGCASDTGRPAACRNLIIAGHRCKTWPGTWTNENTLNALRIVAKSSGRPWCEIDTWPNGDGGRAQGGLVVWHDPTWQRVADPDTTEGIPDEVVDTVMDDIRPIRTTGGQPVATLGAMIRLAGKTNVPQMVEWKWDLSDRADNLVALAKRVDAKILWYGVLGNNDCSPHNVIAFADAGAITGVKSSPDCPVTATEAKRWGARFVVVSSRAINTRMVRWYKRNGLGVWPFLTSDEDRVRLVRAGVAGLIVRDAVRTERWRRL